MNNSRGARERLPFLSTSSPASTPAIWSVRKRAELLGKAEESGTQANALAALDTLSEVGSAHEKARSKVFLATSYDSGRT